jgi:hypothetical protein
MNGSRSCSTDTRRSSDFPAPSAKARTQLEGPKAGPVFVVCGENFDDVHLRLAALLKDRYPELADSPYYVTKSAAALTMKESAANVGTAVRKMSERLGVQPALVVVDTLWRNYGPSDENSAASMAVFIDNIDRHLRLALGCAVVIVHHAGHDSTRARGSSSLKAALHMEMQSARSGDKLTITCTRMKNAALFPPMHFQMRSVDLGEVDAVGKPITSIVLDRIDAFGAAADDKGMGANQRQIVTAFDKLACESLMIAGTNNDTGGSTSVVRVSLKELRDASGLEAKQWSEAFKPLTKRGFKQDGEHVFRT